MSCLTANPSMDARSQQVVELAFGVDDDGAVDSDQPRY